MNHPKVIQYSTNPVINTEATRISLQKLTTFWKPCTKNLGWEFNCLCFHFRDNATLTSWWKNFALAGSNLMATVTVLKTMCRRLSTWDTGISFQGDTGSPWRHPSIDTRTLITYTKPPTFRNTVRVLWLSRRHINKDCRKEKLKTIFNNLCSIV